LLYAGGMGYAILRVQKLKSTVAVRRSMKHAHREQPTPNADSERTPANTHIGAQSADEGVAKVAALLPEKRRSDAVLCVEYLVTASPEAMAGKSREQQDAYLHDALAWIRERHGEANVVYAGIHRDEATPHLYAYAVPLDADTGRLNAKKWLGGAKALSQMQTDFAERVGKAHGLERGIEGSRATHQRVQRFYGAIQQEPAHATIAPSSLAPRVLEKGLFSKTVETPEQVAERLTKAVRQGYAPAVAAAAGARLERDKAKQAQDTADDLRRRMRPVVDALAPLSKQQQARVLAVMTVESRELVKQAAAEKAKADAAKAAERAAKAAQRKGRGDAGWER
jgi:hypothetical protein